jgi:hypothetical protein
MPEFELDLDEWNELGQWRRLTILHTLTGRETALD